MTRERATDPIGFGTGISTDHKDGIRWVDYSNISWNPVFCKRCDICVEICPKNTLVLRNDAILEEENCILCGLCERYCPDLAIEMIKVGESTGALEPALVAGARERLEKGEAIAGGAVAESVALLVPVSARTPDELGAGE